jgi:hypothetical protein
MEEHKEGPKGRVGAEQAVHSASPFLCIKDLQVELGRPEMGFRRSQFNEYVIVYAFDDIPGIRAILKIAENGFLGFRSIQGKPGTQHDLIGQCFHFDKYDGEDTILLLNLISPKRESRVDLPA